MQNKMAYGEKQGKAVLLAAAGLLAAIFSVGGCEMFKRYPYETVNVPREKLNRIEKLDLEAMSTIKEETGPPEQEPTAAEPPKQRELSIEECRAMALKNNLDLKVTSYESPMAQEGVRLAEAAFEPLVFSQMNFTKTDAPVSLTLDASKQQYFSNTAGVEVPLRTGGIFTLSHPFSWTQTNNIFSTLDESYTTDLAFSVQQPLLRGGGVRTNTHYIRLARYDTNIAQAMTKLEVTRVLADVDRAYWQLYAVNRLLEVRRLERDLALAQKERAERMVKAGQTGEIEILRAEAAVAERVEGVILAENDVRDRQRALKQIINEAGLEIGNPTTLILTTGPNPQHYTLDHDKLIDYSFANRMELLEIELQIAKDVSTVDFARNNMLPYLALDYTYNINALSKTADDAYELMGRNRFADHRAGLVLQIPIGNQSAQSKYRRNVLQKLQHLANKQQREKQIVMEVLDTADQLEANWQRVLVTRKSSELAERTLRAEERQFELGMQISTEVLDAQTRYTNALWSAAQALAEYQLAQVDLAYATGSLLEAAQVEFMPEPQKENEIKKAGGKGNL